MDVKAKCGRPGRGFIITKTLGPQGWLIPSAD